MPIVAVDITADGVDRGPQASPSLVAVEGSVTANAGVPYSSPELSTIVSYVQLYSLNSFLDR